MNCCENITRKEFLVQKLTNFRMFLEPHCSTDELKEQLNQFQDIDTVMPYLLQCVALSRVGQLDAAFENFVSSFPAETQADEAFRAKLKRYLAMFVDVLTS